MNRLIKVLLPFFCLMILAVLIWLIRPWELLFPWRVTFFDSPETTSVLANPERGWYGMYKIVIPDEPFEQDEMDNWLRKDLLPDVRSRHTLAQVIPDISAFRDTEISEAGLDNLGELFDTFRKSGMKMILRVAYDTDGNAKEKEPAALEIVLKHMNQLAAVLNENKDLLYVVQGVLVGDYAEMHDSVLLDEYYPTLIEEWRKAVPSDVFLSVRTPTFWRRAAQSDVPLTDSEAFSGSLAASTGLFNDCFLSSETDVGTYLEEEYAGDADFTAFDKKHLREDELQFQQVLTDYVPFGGETCRECDLSNIPQAIDEMRLVHLSYLHDSYFPDVITKWKNTTYDVEGVFNNKSAFDYISAHMGYRLLLRGVEADRRYKTLSVTVENAGFAGFYYPKDVFLTVLSGDGIQTVFMSSSDVRDWKGGSLNTAEFDLSGTDLESGEYLMYLQILDPTDGTCVRLANESRLSVDGCNSMFGVLSIP